MASENPASPPPAPRLPVALHAVLLAVGVVLVATAVPGQFTIDESSYVVTVTGLRHGQFTVPGTEGLTPSMELAWFDPTIRSARPPRSPIGSTAPPLYAFLALPFSFLGWRGLMALETLAFLVTAALVFWLARRHARLERTAWIATATYVLGGYTLEYAQAVWPHALSVCLCALGFCAASVTRDRWAPGLAALSGFAIGMATGVRYQNVLFAGATLLGIVLWSRRRAATAALFAGGLAIPLAASSAINHVRLGSWNPISKGAGYFAYEHSVGKTRGLLGALFDTGHVLWAKVVDFSVHPVPWDPVIDIQDWWLRDPQTGAVVFYGAIKKAWLQSSPWLALALGVMLLAWRPRREGRLAASGRERELRAIAVVVVAVLGAFAVAGFDRHDGVCFNQRYFLELVPFGAVAVAWALEERPFALGAAAAGALAGAIGCATLLRLPAASPARQYLELRLPLLIAGLVVFAFWTFVSSVSPKLLAVAFGMAVGWAAVVDVGEDVIAADSCRSLTLDVQRALERALPHERLALFAQKPLADILAPLALKRDIVILETSVDEGRAADGLAVELAGKGRRLFVLPAGMPQELATRMRSRFSLAMVPAARPIPLVELTARPAGS
jgi:hypothetical protein